MLFTLLAVLQGAVQVDTASLRAWADGLVLPAIEKSGVPGAIVISKLTGELDSMPKEIVTTFAGVAAARDDGCVAVATDREAASRESRRPDDGVRGDQAGT